MTWVSVEEFASWTGEAVSTIRKKCQSGELPSKKFGVRWKIDKDLFEKQAEEEMLNRMKPAVFKASLNKTKPSIGYDKEWAKMQKKKMLDKFLQRSV